MPLPLIVWGLVAGVTALTASGCYREPEPSEDEKKLNPEDVQDELQDLGYTPDTSDSVDDPGELFEDYFDGTTVLQDKFFTDSHDLQADYEDLGLSNSQYDLRAARFNDHYDEETGFFAHWDNPYCDEDRETAVVEDCRPGWDPDVITRPNGLSYACAPYSNVAVCGDKVGEWVPIVYQLASDTYYDRDWDQRYTFKYTDGDRSADCEIVMRRRHSRDLNEIDPFTFPEDDDFVDEYPGVWACGYGSAGDNDSLSCGSADWAEEKQVTRTDGKEITVSSCRDHAEGISRLIYGLDD